MNSRERIRIFKEDRKGSLNAHQVLRRLSVLCEGRQYVEAAHLVNRLGSSALCVVATEMPLDLLAEALPYSSALLECLFNRWVAWRWLDMVKVCRGKSGFKSSLEWMQMQLWWECLFYVLSHDALAEISWSHEHFLSVSLLFFPLLQFLFSSSQRHVKNFIFLLSDSMRWWLDRSRTCLSIGSSGILWNCSAVHVTTILSESARSSLASSERGSLKWRAR